MPANARPCLPCLCARIDGLLEPLPAMPLAPPSPKKKGGILVRIASAFGNVALALVSCLAALLLCELGLRLFVPKYAHLADAAFLLDADLLFVRIPNHRHFRWHPDTGAQIPVFHNNLGLRQHRDFTTADLESSLNLGFFGDSFTENVGMPVHFSFTEPLDYLLNVENRRGINVLNFGVEGYGTAQSLLRYEMWAGREALDHVFYVYWTNDPVDNFANRLFRLDESGQLARGEAAPGPFAPLAGLHVTYLGLDVAGRLTTHLSGITVAGEERKREWLPRSYRYINNPPPSAYVLFRLLLRRFKAAVEGHGASFHMVWLPAGDSDDGIGRVADIVREEGVESINLRDCFAALDPAYPHTPWEDSPYRFELDAHWNEVGNRLGAVCLHRFLAERLELPRLNEAEVNQALDRYYAAFEQSGAEGFAADDPAAVAIRARYDALGGAFQEDPRFHRVPPPQALVIRSHFDVYLHDGWLAYVREGCEPGDFDLRFFLHIDPVDEGDLPPHRAEHGFDNGDFAHRFGDSGCTLWRELPPYSIAGFRTGQFSGDEETGWDKLWEAEHILQR